MRPIAFFLIGLSLTFAAGASIPSGQQFGSWGVTSIASVSGSEGSDALAKVTQAGNCDADGNNCDSLSVHWLQGNDISVSASFQDCYGEDKDFDADYSIAPEHWLAAGKLMERRIEADFSTWIGQATLACSDTARLNAFKLGQIRKAVRDFSRRLSVLNQ